MEIVVATRNRKKIEEIERILEGLPVRLLMLDDFPDCPNVEETEDTFRGNALLKAKAVSSCTGLAAIADDSGLEVDALGGAPGVFSARYAGQEASDKENVGKLLREMQSVPDDRRTARFICVIALAVPGRGETFFEGRVEGGIGLTPAGRWGFGYDPVFYPEGLKKTFAEMAPSEKDSMSHRARALEQLKNHLISRGFFGNRAD